MEGRGSRGKGGRDFRHLLLRTNKFLRILRKAGEGNWGMGRKRSVKMIEINVKYNYQQLKSLKSLEKLFNKQITRSKDFEAH